MGDGLQTFWRFCGDYWQTGGWYRKNQPSRPDDYARMGVSWDSTCGKFSWTDCYARAAGKEFLCELLRTIYIHSGRFRRQDEQRGTVTLQKMYNWCEQNKLAVATDKTDGILLKRRLNDRSQRIFITRVISKLTAKSLRIDIDKDGT